MDNNQRVSVPSIPSELEFRDWTKWNIEHEHLTDKAYGQFASKQMFKQDAGETAHRVIARAGNGTKTGTLTYTTKPGRGIRVAEVRTVGAHQRQGVATALLNGLKAKHPNQPIDMGKFSPAGQKWFDSVSRSEPDSLELRDWAAWNLAHKKGPHLKPDEFNAELHKAFQAGLELGRTKAGLSDLSPERAEAFAGIHERNALKEEGVKQAHHAGQAAGYQAHADEKRLTPTPVVLEPKIAPVAPVTVAGGSVHLTGAAAPGTIGHDWEQTKPWNLTRAQLEGHDTADGIHFDPSKTNEATNHRDRDGKIHIGPKFFALSEASRRAVLYHELGHDLSDAMLHDDSAWKLADDGHMPGGKHTSFGTINGQTTPGESLAEAYSILHTEPEYLDEHFPALRDAILAKAKAMHYPLPATAKSAPLDFAGDKKTARKWGTENYREWNVGLPPEQQLALSRYTQGGHGSMNGTLRRGEDHGADTQTNIDNLTLALASAPPTPHTIVSRGTTMTGDTLAAMSTLQAGDTFTDKGFGSTALAGEWGGNVRMRITLPEGLRGAGYPLYANDEQEMLLQRGMQYSVDSTSTDADGTLRLGLTALGSDVMPATRSDDLELRHNWAEWDAEHRGGIRLYHGTAGHNADAIHSGGFDLNKTERFILGKGVSLTADKKIAGRYAPSGHVLEVHADVHNVASPEATKAIIDKLAPGASKGGLIYLTRPQSDAVTEEAKRQGHDGLSYDDGTVIVFDPKRLSVAPATRANYELEYRNWDKWHLQHPYIPHPRLKTESAQQYDKRLKSDYSKWLREGGATPKKVKSTSVKAGHILHTPNGPEKVTAITRTGGKVHLSTVDATGQTHAHHVANTSSSHLLKDQHFAHAQESLGSHKQVKKAPAKKAVAPVKATKSTSTTGPKVGKMISLGEMKPGMVVQWHDEHTGKHDPPTKVLSVTHSSTGFPVVKLDNGEKPFTEGQMLMEETKLQEYELVKIGPAPKASAAKKLMLTKYKTELKKKPVYPKAKKSHEDWGESSDSLEEFMARPADERFRQSTLIWSSESVSHDGLSGDVEPFFAGLRKYQGGSTDAPKTVAEAMAKDFLEQCDARAKQFPKLALYRGVALMLKDGKDKASFDKWTKVGSTFEMHPSSWTTDKGTAADFSFASSGSQASVTFVVKQAFGADISKFSDIPTEHEVVSGGKYKIVKVEETSSDQPISNKAKHYVVYLEQIEAAVKPHPQAAQRSDGRLGGMNLAFPSESLPEGLRSWLHWNQEHPYVPHPRPRKAKPGETAKEYDDNLKKEFSIKPSVSHLPPQPLEHITSTLFPVPNNGQPVKDLTPIYLGTDLHGDETAPWGKVNGSSRYGVVTFDDQGRVLLREPTNHFDGYHWTFPKGHPDHGEHPLISAQRENLEETGHQPAVVGYIPGGFGGTSTGSKQHFYLGNDKDGLVDGVAMSENGETAHLKWATPIEALNLISQSTNLPGRYRDLQILKAAYEAYGQQHPEHDFPKINLPPPPPKPKKYFRPAIFNPDDPAPKALTSASYPKSHGYVSPYAGQTAAHTTIAQELGTKEGEDPWAAIMKQTQAKIHASKKKRAGSHEELDTRDWINMKIAGTTSPLPPTDTFSAEFSRDGMGQLEYRNWKKWHEEHPYIPHPRKKNETAGEYDARLKRDYKDWLHTNPVALEGRKQHMFAKKQTDAMAKAQLKADKIPEKDRGKRFDGTGPMTDEEYAQHRNHVEYEATRHGADSLTSTPFSTHNSEDRVDGAEGAYTVTRQAQQQKIIDEIIKRAESVPDGHQAIIMGGPGGAGKSTILRKNAEDKDSTASKLGIRYAHYAEKDDPANHISKGDGIGDPINYVTLNPDDIKSRMAELGMVPNIDHLSPMEAAGPFAHEEASEIVQRIARQLTAQGKNVIWDITLNSEKSGVDRIDALRDTPGGYHIAGVFVDVHLGTSDRNARARHRHGQDDFNAGKPGSLGGRFVPSGLIISAVDPDGKYASVNRASFEKLKADGRFDQTLTYNNEGYAGELIDQSGKTLATRAMGNMPNTSTITTMIEQYRAGKVSWNDLLSTLANHRYTPPSYFDKPDMTMYDLEDVNREEPGTWNEVTAAADRGLLTNSEYTQIHSAMCAAHGDDR